MTAIGGPSTSAGHPPIPTTGDPFFTPAGRTRKFGIPRFVRPHQVPRFFRAEHAYREEGFLTDPDMIADPRPVEDCEEVVLDEVTEEPLELWGRPIRIDPRLAKRGPRRAG